MQISEALQTVLAKIDQLAEDDPIDQIWFMGIWLGMDLIETNVLTYYENEPM